jgi:hypothetical protein
MVFLYGNVGLDTELSDLVSELAMQDFRTGLGNLDKCGILQIAYDGLQQCRAIVARAEWVTEYKAM